MTGPGSDAKLSALYQELILDHYRRPRNKGTLPSPTASASLRNPLCGDEVDVQVDVRDGRVADVRFGGRGCSISQASASMMTELVKGRTPEEVRALGERFADMIRGDESAAKDQALGQARALAGVARFPTRVRCALIAWEAMARAVEALTRAP
jgi:nitrogen fixation NifU-like protein